MKRPVCRRRRHTDTERLYGIGAVRSDLVDEYRELMGPRTVSRKPDQPRL